MDNTELEALYQKVSKTPNTHGVCDLTDEVGMQVVITDRQAEGITMTLIRGVTAPYGDFSDAGEEGNVEYYRTKDGKWSQDIVVTR